MEINNAYQYVPITTPPKTVGGGTKMSLSLSDLILDETPQFSKSLPIGQSSDYKKELAKLLTKSRGTAYEKTLKRFVESKYKEMQEDEENRAFELSRSTNSLLNLSTSKYDTQQRASVFDSSVLTERESRMKEMAKPMERNKYKVPTVTATSNITTNSIGRQRPSPLKPRPYEFTSASPSATARASAAFSLTSGNSAVIRSSTARHNSSTAAHIQQPPGTAAVSVREFNAWLAKNRAWEQKHKDKIQHVREERVEKAVQLAKPTLYAKKSLKLAELANTKETRRLRSSLDSSASAAGVIENNNDDGDEMSVQSGASSLGGRSRSSHNKHNDNAADDDGDDGSAMSVFDRLAERGRLSALLRLNWEPSSDMQPHHPVILESSRRIARGRELRRSSSAADLEGGGGSSRWRGSSHSSETALVNRLQERSLSARSRRPADVHPVQRHFLIGSGMSKILAAAAAGDSRSGSPTAATTASTHANRLSMTSVKSTAVSPTRKSAVTLKLSDLSTKDSAVLSSRGRSRSPAVGRRISSSRGSGGDDGDSVCSAPAVVDLRLLASGGIDRTRSLSATRRQLDGERSNRRNYIEPGTVIKPFQPTLVAKETERIMSRISSTFEERTVKSVENHYVRDAVARRAVSPGPGHYVNVNVAVSPQKTVRATRSSLSSPASAVLPSSSATSTNSANYSNNTPSSSSSTKNIPASPSASSNKNTAVPMDRASLLGSPLVGSKGYSFGKERLGRFSYSKGGSSPSPTRADRGTH